MGQIIFKSDARRARDSKFARGRRHAGEHVCDLLEQEWNLKRPSVLLSITGSAQDMPRQRARAIPQAWPDGGSALTSAWVISGGMDSGVMGLTGHALRDVGGGGDGAAQRGRTPCIGIAPWRKVMHREKLWVDPNDPSGYRAARGPPQHGGAVREAEAQLKGENAIDPNHTHFLLVENGKEEFGGEIDFRGKLEHACASASACQTCYSSCRAARARTRPCKRASFRA